MYGSNGGAFDAEDLPVGDGLLTSTGRVLVNGLAEVRIQAEKVRNAAGVVAVPVGEQYVRELRVGNREPGGDQVGPLRNALAGVDENSAGAGSYDIGVCALKCELVKSLSCLVRLNHYALEFLLFQHSDPAHVSLAG